MLKLSFWSNVKAYLTGDMNQTWLAKEIGISPSNLSMMISRDTIPKADVAYRIAQVLGIPLPQLLKEVESIHCDKVGEHDFGFYDDKESPSALIPLCSTRIRYEDESEILSSKNFIGSIRILKDLTKGSEIDKLIGVRVLGDEMSGMHIYENDIVIFEKGTISSNELYVIALGNMISVRRLEFIMVKNEVSIMCENSRYTTITTTMEDPKIKILGRVVGWIHAHK